MIVSFNNSIAFASDNFDILPEGTCSPLDVPVVNVPLTPEAFDAKILPAIEAGIYRLRRNGGRDR